MEQAGAECSDLTVATLGEGEPPLDEVVPSSQDRVLIRLLEGPGHTPLPDLVEYDPNAPEWRRGMDIRTHKEITDPIYRQRDVQGWPLIKMAWKAEDNIYSASDVDQRL